MGHERVGFLPRTQRWRDIVAGIGGETFDVGDVVRQTLDNVRDRLEQIQNDESVVAAFKFLVCLPVAARAISPVDMLREHGIEVPADPSPIALAQALQRFMPERPDSLEYARIAQNAVVDSIAEWAGRVERPEDNLFGVSGQPFDVWRQAADGAGFCELSRIFFGKFTERYLNYFLEREASAVLPSIERRERFADELSRHVDAVSRHAFETAKITQSFAAGWFNKHAKAGVPSDASIQGFLRLAVSKLGEELTREGPL